MLTSGANASAAAALPAVSEADIQRRIDAAVGEAQQESEESMNDLLVCLGQEEAKVGRCASTAQMSCSRLTLQYEFLIPTWLAFLGADCLSMI